MLNAHLLHNPSAGDEDHSESELVKEIESHGFRCRYSSTKENDWKEIDDDTDFLVIAGGDGTIRKIAKQMLKSGDTRPIAILPKGTANNIAASLLIQGDNKTIIESWKRKNLHKFSIGDLTINDEKDFFLEGVGFGLFPQLMREMDHQGKDKIEDPEKKKKAAWNLLYDLASAAEPFSCTVIADGKKITDNALLVEAMNIKSIGPNLILSHSADTSDDILELVMVQASDRQSFSEYIYTCIKSNGRSSNFVFPVIRARHILLAADHSLMHVDDEMRQEKKSEEITLTIRNNSLSFFV